MSILENKIGDSIKNQTLITFSYKSEKDSNETIRCVAPFGLVEDYAHNKFILAYDVDKSGYRTYNLDKVVSLNTTTDVFEASNITTTVDPRWSNVIAWIDV